MADSLLDINFDIDKFLGTTNQPLSGLITDPNYKSSLNVDTLLGAGLGYTGSLYKDKTIPEKLLATAVGAKAAREKGISDAVKKLLQTQDYTKNMLDITKTKGDILKQPYDLQSARVKSVLDTSKLDGIQRFVKTLPPMKAAELALDPDSYFSNNKITEEERMLYQALGIQDRFNIPKDKAGMVTYFNQLPDQKDVDAHNAEENRKAQNDPLYKPNYLNNGKLDFIKRLAVTNGTPLNKQLSQQDVPEGQVRTSNGKLMSLEEFDKLPLRVQEYLDPDLDIDSFRERKEKVLDARVKDKGLTRYGLTTTRDVSKNIEKILDDPEALNALFTTKGRFAVKFNEETKNWFAESGGKAADVANFLNSLKSKQFTEQIQRMRANNPTGGAVGNVSDREVAMFQNMQEYLSIGGSRDKLYEALVDLYGKSKILSEEYKAVFIEDYGEKQWSDTLNNAMHTYKEYAPTAPEALRKVRGENITEKVNEKINPSVKFLNPKSQKVMEQLLQSQIKGN